MKAAEAISAEGAANLILGALAFVLALLGAAAWWVAAHPDETRAFIYRLRNRPRLRRAESRYRGGIEFLVRRFRTEGAFGLSFTAGLTALAVSVWVFGSVLQDVLAHEEVAVFDAPTVSYIAAHRVNWLTTAMEGITYLGSGRFLMAVVVASGLILRYRTGAWRALLLLACAAIGAMTLEMVTKFAIARPRPLAQWMAIPATGWSFPSGHTIQSTAVYGALAYLIAETQAAWRTKVRLAAFAVVIAFLAGVSRVYLGVHWPTDVMGAWALGTAWLAILFTTSSTIEKVLATNTGERQSRRGSAPDGLG